MSIFFVILRAVHKGQVEMNRNNKTQDIAANAFTFSFKESWKTTARRC